MENQRLTIKNAFAGGLVDGSGKDKVPEGFSHYLRNARIENQSIIPRKGYGIAYAPPFGGVAQGMTYNRGLISVWAGGAFVFNGTIIGGIGTTGKVNFINYGKICIILTGIGNPRWFDTDTTILTQVPDANMPVDYDIATEYSSPIRPMIGASFTGFTFIAGNRGYENVMYVSKRVGMETDVGGENWQYQNAYDWSPVVIAGQEFATSRAFTSPIVGMVANMNNLYIFCKNTIEILGQNSASSVNGVEFILTRPIGDGDQLMNERCATTANSVVFYLSRSMRFKTIGFIPGKTEPEIGDLSDRVGRSISETVRRLSANQDDAWCVYCREDNTVRRFLKSINSQTNDVCILYDITNDQFLFDDNQNFYHGTISGFGNTYAMDYLGSVNILNDGFTDNNTNINFEYNTPRIHLGDPIAQKQWRGLTLGGAINQETELTINIYVDGNLEMTRTLSYADIDVIDQNTYITGSTPPPLGARTNYPFTSIFDDMRTKGKKIRIQILSNSTFQSFYLDFMQIWYRMSQFFTLGDKVT